MQVGSHITSLPLQAHLGQGRSRMAPHRRSLPLAARTISRRLARHLPLALSLRGKLPTPLHSRARQHSAASSSRQLQQAMEVRHCNFFVDHTADESCSPCLAMQAVSEAAAAKIAWTAKCWRNGSS